MDRELNRGLIRPPQVTYKELWMLREKESNGKMPWNGISVRTVLIFEWNFCCNAPEVCDVWLKSVARRWGLRRVAGELNACNEFHLQLYFFCSVFLTRAGCVSGVVCVLRDGLASVAAFVCKKLTQFVDRSQPFWREAHLTGRRVLATSSRVRNENT
jgi:hypothetical protein